uniref:RRM domain-containing protein n=1 Tax=Glossina pallidipes TaxID=7398 RepID=A0A1A9ZR71_GLOPL
MPPADMSPFAETLKIRNGDRLNYACLPSVVATLSAKRRRKIADYTDQPKAVVNIHLIPQLYKHDTMDMDVLHKICNPHGQVLRIVIFKKNGVQAMVEFDSLDAATRARENLNGADIYSGCCTLKIDFAKNSANTTLTFKSYNASQSLQLHTPYFMQVSNNSKDIVNLWADSNAFEIKCSLLVLNYCGRYSTVLQRAAVLLRPGRSNATGLIGK